MRMFNIKKHISTLKGSSDGKTVVKNMGYLVLLQIAGYIFPLITLPYLANVIGANGFGKIAFAAAIISWIQTIADWGFNYTATRDVAKNREDKKTVSQIFSNVLWARIILASISFLILLVVIYLVPSFRKETAIILITFMMIPGHIFFPDWFFQAIEKMKYTTIFNLLIKLIFTLLVFIFIRDPEDYILQPLFTSLGYITCGLISMWLILRKWGYSIKKPNLRSIYLTIKSSSDVFINNLIPNSYNSFSVLLLGAQYGNIANGIFEGGNKFISIAHQFHSVISRAFFPFLSRKNNKHGIYVIVNMTTGILVALTLFLSAPIIVKYMLAPEFADSVNVIRILSVSMIFLIMSNTYGTNYLIIVHKEKLLRNIMITCSIVGLIISYPLIKYYSYMGAAATVLICRFLIGLSLYICATRVKRKIRNNI